MLYIGDKNFCLLLGSNKYMYFLRMDETDSCMVEIPGHFDNGYIINAKKVACCSKGIMYFYYINIEKEEYHLIENNKVIAHYDDITFAFVKDTMVNLFTIISKI